MDTSAIDGSGHRNFNTNDLEGSTSNSFLGHLEGKEYNHL